MSPRHRRRNPLKPTVLFKPKRGVVPGLQVLPLDDYEKLSGRRVNSFERREGCNVEFVVENNGVIRYLRVLESGARFQAGGDESKSATRSTGQPSPETARSE